MMRARSALLLRRRDPLLSGSRRDSCALRSETPSSCSSVSGSPGRGAAAQCEAVAPPVRSGAPPDCKEVAEVPQLDRRMRQSVAWPTTCSCAIRSLRPHSSFFATRCQTKTMCSCLQEHCRLSGGNARDVQSASGSLIDTSCVSILSAEARPVPERTGARHGYVPVPGTGTKESPNRGDSGPERARAVHEDVVEAERNPTASAPVSTAASPRLEISTRGGYGSRRPATVERV